MNEYVESTSTFLSPLHLSPLKDDKSETSHFSPELMRCKSNREIKTATPYVSLNCFLMEKSPNGFILINPCGVQSRSGEEEHLLAAAVQAVRVLLSHRCVLHPDCSLQRCPSTPTHCSWTWEGVVILWHVYCRSCQCCVQQQMFCIH